MPKKKRFKQPSLTFNIRETENLFDQELFYSDFRKFSVYSGKSLAYLGRQIGIERMAMSRYFRKETQKIYVNDFFVLCKLMGKDYTDYIKKINPAISNGI